MKSKTSFFNKAIYKKNMTLYWPIWVCYLIYGMAKLGGSLWSGLQQMTKITEERKLVVIVNSLSMWVDIWVIAAVVTVTGMAMFSYLFSSKSANMIHALPVTRKELFFTNVISGLSVLWIPQIVTFVLSVLVCLANGIALVQYLGIWLLSVMGISFFLFSTVVFCAMLTGQLFALPVYFFGLNFLSVGALFGVKSVVTFLGYGLDLSSFPEFILLRILSPINYLLNNVRFRTSSYLNQLGDEVITGVTYRGGKVVAGYAIAAIAIYVIAYYAYKQREIESAGDLLTFRWIKPVFRWGVGIGVAYACAIILADFFGSVLIWISTPFFFVIVLVLSVIAFLVADMFVQKTFRVVKKKRVKECGLFLAFVAVSFGGFYAVAYGLQNKIPDKKNVEYAYLEMNYPVEFNGNEVQKAIDMQKDILAHATEFQKNLKDASSTISVTYVLKDGKRLSRSYWVPISADSGHGRKLAQLQYGYETNPKSFLTYLFGYDYKKLTQFHASQFEYYDETNNYMSKTVKADVAYRLYQAIQKDAEAGVLQKYNTVDFADMEEEPEYDTAGLNLSFLHESKNWQDVYQRASGELRSTEYDTGDTMREGYAYIAFGRDCKNILKTLAHEGLIDSVDQNIFFTNGQDK